MVQVTRNSTAGSWFKEQENVSTIFSTLLSFIFISPPTQLHQAPFKRSDLSTSHIYLLDSGSEAFVWVGKSVEAGQKRNAMILADFWLQTKKGAKNSHEGDFYPLCRMEQVGWFLSSSQFSIGQGRASFQRIV